MRLLSPVFQLVLLMVSLVVQMVGGVGDAGVVRGRGDGMGDPYPGGGVAAGMIFEGDVGTGRWCRFRWCCLVRCGCCRRCPSC